MARNQKLAATVTIGAVLQGSVKKNISVLRSGLESVGGAIRSVTERQRELSKQRQVLVKQGKSVEALDREYEKLKRTLIDLERKQKRWENALKASARVGKEFGNMRRELGSLARRAAYTGAAVGAAIFGIANSTASLGDNVAKTADKLGFSIAALQELRYAAERSGVSVESFDSSMLAMSKRLGEAAQGSGAAKKALEQLGLSAKALIELEPDQALAAIADKMKDIKNPAERAALASALFSRAGVGMVNMLKDGSDGLDALRESARRTGYVLSDQAARDAEVFKDQLLDTQLAVAGLKNTIGAALMPVVTRVMGRMSDLLLENRERVVAFADDLADGLERAIPVVGSVMTGLGKVSGKVGAIIGKVAEMVGGWENFGMVIGALFASKAIMSVGAFALSVGKLGWALLSLSGVMPLLAGGIRAIGLAMAANPIGAAVAVIAGGALLVMANWEKVEPVIGPILDWMGEKFTWFWENAGLPLVEGLRYGVEGIGTAWQGLQRALGAVLDWMGEKFDWLLGKLQPVIDGMSRVGDGIKKVGSWVGLGDGPAVSSGTGGAGGREVPPGRGGVQRRALGGGYGPGWRLVGEQGPELEYKDRGGFIAHNGALQRLSEMAQGARSGMASAGAGASRAAASVVQNITINAQGLSAAQVASEIQRRGRAASNGALFDQPLGFGQYGGS